MVYKCMMRLGLYAVFLICLGCGNTARTESLSKVNAVKQYQSEKQADSTENTITQHYRIISVENTYTFQWTGKTFAGTEQHQADTFLVNAVMKGFNATWRKHAFTVVTKDVWILKDSVRKEAVTVVALKSTEKEWIPVDTGMQYFLIDEYKAPLCAVPYFEGNTVYAVCIAPSFKMVGDELRPSIDRKSLYKDVLKPLIDNTVSVKDDKR